MSTKSRSKSRVQKAVLLKTVLGLMVLLTLITVLRVAALNFWTPSKTAFMRSDALKPKPIEFVPLAKISPNAAKAVLAAEDDLFFEHSGFQWDSIKKAWSHNQKRKSLRGASTLTQQLARNLFLSRDKTWTRKIKEAGLTVLLELFLSKERILELYLNVAEMGPGVYGVGQASRYHFGVTPDQLSQVQSSLLAAVLINGKIYGKKPYPDSTLTRQKKILYRMTHYALALPNAFAKPVKAVAAKDDEKQVQKLIQNMTEQEAETPDEAIEAEADLMLVLTPQNHPPDSVQGESPNPNETLPESDQPNVFLDED